jgi:hypothetical protein
LKKVLTVILLSISLVGLASTIDEISHLLAFVESTDCTFERNGDRHSGIEAVKHINDKYKYYSSDIETAEDFIMYSATKSRISSRFYTVHCGDQLPIKSRDWLLKELKHYRSIQ